LGVPARFAASKGLHVTLVRHHVKRFGEAGAGCIFRYVRNRPAKKN
jgi:hypothetical protein